MPIFKRTLAAADFLETASKWCYDKAVRLDQKFPRLRNRYQLRQHPGYPAYYFTAVTGDDVVYWRGRPRTTQKPHLRPTPTELGEMYASFPHKALAGDDNEPNPTLDPDEGHLWVDIATIPGVANPDIRG